MEQEEYKPKISIVEIIYITPIYIISDGIGVTLALFGLDDFGLLDIFLFPLSQIYLRIKGINGTLTLIGNILETIPYIGALPNRIITWLIVIYLDRHPKLEKMTKKINVSPKIAPSKISTAK